MSTVLAEANGQFQQFDKALVTKLATGSGVPNAGNLAILIECTDGNYYGSLLVDNVKLTAGGVAVPLNNPSFESPALGPGGYLGKAPDRWTGKGTTGSWRPTTFPIPDGQQIGYIDRFGSLYQDLGMPTDPAASYQLSVDLASETGFSDWHIALVTTADVPQVRKGTYTLLSPALQDATQAAMFEAAQTVHLVGPGPTGISGGIVMTFSNYADSTRPDQYLLRDGIYDQPTIKTIAALHAGLAVLWAAVFHPAQMNGTADQAFYDAYHIQEPGLINDILGNVLLLPTVNYSVLGGYSVK